MRQCYIIGKRAKTPPLRRPATVDAHKMRDV
jgi:hypothetical protein